jgi:hypothetical protein
MAPTFSHLRINPSNPNHHLQFRNRQWWVRFVARHDDGERQIIRYPLATADVLIARNRRDHLFEGKHRLTVKITVVEIRDNVIEEPLFKAMEEDLGTTPK